MKDGLSAMRNKKQRLKYLLREIEKGNITSKNFYSKINIHEYVEFNKKLKEAVREKQLKVFKNNRPSDVTFISGRAGVGKTTLAKFLNIKNQKFYTIKSQGKYPLDETMGYESIIYVNLNPSTFKPKDFLRFFDQSDELFGLSRYYKSKVITANEIILDSTLNLNGFSEMLKKSNITPIDFYSKINHYIYLEDKKMFIYKFDKEKALKNIKDNNEIQDYISSFYTLEEEKTFDVEEIILDLGIKHKKSDIKEIFLDLEIEDK